VAPVTRQGSLIAPNIERRIDMLYMLISRTRPGLTQEQYAELAELAKRFYASVPPGLTLHGDWGAVDGSCTFSVLETEERALLEQIQAPFQAYVDMELTAVTAISGWTKG
jgi:hypothetical protein